MFQALDLTTVSKPTKSFTPLNLGATASAPPIAPATPAAPQGFFSNLVNGAKTLGQDVWSAFTAPAQNVQGPFSTTKPSVASDITLSTLNSYANSLKEAGSRLSANQALFSDKTSTPLDRGISTVSAGIGVLGAFLAPLSAAGAGAEKIPVLGPIATGINNLFSAIGKGGADVAQGALYSLPFVSDQTKAKLNPLVQEIGSLSAQIVAGKGGGDVYDSFVAKTKELTARLSDHVAEVEKPTPSFEPLNIQKPVEAPALKADTSVPFEDKQHLYHGTTEINLESIAKDGLRPGRRGLLSLSKDEAYSKSYAKTPDFYKVQKDGVMLRVEADYMKGKTTSPSKTAPTTDQMHELLTKETIPPEVIEIYKDGKWQPLKSSPSIPKELGTKSSKIGKSIEAKAVESNLTKSFEGTAQYEPITIKDQAERATNLVNKDIQTARDIIKGTKPLPDNLKGTALITAMEEHIKQNPSADLAYELANSHLVSETSAAGQELRLAAERTPDSATARIIEIKKAREAKIENAPKKRAAALKQANQAIKGLNLDQVDLGKIESFIDSFTC